MGRSTRRGARLRLYVGLLLVVVAVSVAHALSHSYSFPTGASHAAAVAAYGLMLGFAAYAVGFPDAPAPRRGNMMRALQSALLGILGISLVQLFIGMFVIPRSVVLSTALASVPWSMWCATNYRSRWTQVAKRERVVLVADEAERKQLVEDLEDGNVERPASVVAALSPSAIRESRERFPLLEAVERNAGTVVVLALSAQRDEEILAQAAEAHLRGVRFRSLLNFYEEWIGKLPVSELERASLMFDIGELHSAPYARGKRMLDLVFGVLGMLLLTGLLPFVLIGNAVGNRGPLFYRQERVGKGGGRFVILKLRTMVCGDGLSCWTSEDDRRITAFGRVLRRTHLDELPQAVNLLRGDLSLVGPRPEQPHYARMLEEHIPFYSLRHAVRPGITGWAQVKYGYAGNGRDAVHKLQYEFFYLRHQSLMLDLRIVGRTLRSVVARDGR